MEPAVKPVITALPSEKDSQGVKAVGIIEAHPEVVWRVLIDYDHIYTENVKWQRIIKQEGNITWLYVYSKIKTFTFAYVLRLTAVEEGRHLTWDEDRSDEIVNLLKEQDLKLTCDFAVNRGDWILDTDDRGRTILTYIPWLALSNKLLNFFREFALKTSIPGLYNAIQKRAREITGG